MKTVDPIEDWYIGEPIPFGYVGLRLSPTTPYINDATITAQMMRDGEAIGDPVTATYTADSDGDYSGVVPGSVTDGFTADLIYVLRLTSPNLLKRDIVGKACIRRRR